MLRPVLVSAFLAALGWAQQPLTIPWLASAPGVEGRPDQALEKHAALPLQSGDPGAPQVLLRCAADGEALHVLVQSRQSTLACRDRAYQNGDGLLLVLATPAPEGAPTRRFRVMGFSPQPADRRTWQFAFTWYRDLDLEMIPLTGAQAVWRQTGDTLSVEIRIPWASLAPYHPLLTPDLGLNACFVRAQGENRQFHFLTKDPDLQSEQRPRSYVPVHFEAPPAGAAAWVARPSLGCLEAGQPLLLDTSATAATELRIRILDGEGAGVPGWNRTIQVPGGPAPRVQRLEGHLPPGGYQVHVQGPGRTLAQGLTVLPDGGIPSLRQRIARLGSIDPGTRSTLAFRLQDAEAALAKRAPTDPAPEVRRLLEQTGRDLQALENGRDPIAGFRGLQRRSYRSALDGTLQPYSLRTPAQLDGGKRYPLLVFLHGSGQDDRGILDLRRAPEGWFELAPFGRGTSNCYSADHAQEDLREAIADVMARYPVDPSRIVLAGFSMGGYGVYRTALERPGAFQGLAVFSGAPDLASRWLGPGHPDFLEPANLAAFRGMPIFIFHGTADRNCPFERTRSLVGLLQAAGAEVTWVTEDGKGHELPSSASLDRYFAWMGRLPDRSRVPPT